MPLEKGVGRSARVTDRGSARAWTRFFESSGIRPWTQVRLPGRPWAKYQMDGGLMVWFLVSLLACNGDKDKDDSGGNGGDDSADDSGPIGVDEDGDGYETPDDCDDSNADVNPGATEVCDGIDNDCDDLIDAGDDSFEGGITVFTDSDGDGYGDDATERHACDAGVGTTDVGGDCDDADGEINPDALELCGDKIDSNCDDDPDY